MTTTQTKLHPGVVALDERIRLLRGTVHLMEAKNLPSEEKELEILRQIEVLREKLEFIRRERQEARPALEKRKEEIRSLEALRERCTTDDRLSDAVWMKLLLARKTS